MNAIRLTVLGLLVLALPATALGGFWLAAQLNNIAVGIGAAVVLILVESAALGHICEKLDTAYR